MGWQAYILSDIACTNVVIIFTDITRWAFIDIRVYVSNLLEVYLNIFYHNNFFHHKILEIESQNKNHKNEYDLFY